MAEPKVRVTLPKAGPGEDAVIFVGLNGKGYRIQRGKEVEVPAGVAEILRNADKADDVADNFVRSAGQK